MMPWKWKPMKGSYQKVPYPESESVSAQTNNYEYVEQDGAIPGLSLKEILSVETPSSMEVEEGSITFEKNG